jgi:hypothetical protein
MGEAMLAEAALVEVRFAEPRSPGERLLRWFLLVD